MKEGRLTVVGTGIQAVRHATSEAVSFIVAATTGSELVLGVLRDGAQMTFRLTKPDGSIGVRPAGRRE